MDAALGARLIDEMPVGVVVLRLDGHEVLRIVAANPTAARMLGIDVAAVEGRPLAEVFPDVPPERSAMYRTLCREGGRRELGNVAGSSPAARGTPFVVTAVGLP